MMIKRTVLRASALALALAAACSAGKGDLFLAAAPAVDGLWIPPAFGGGMSLQLGVNEATDFSLEWNTVGSFGSGEDKDRSESRLLFGSFYTPFFGEIRPRIGGTVGLAYVTGPEGEGGQEADLNLGLQLQGLYDVSDRLRLFAEVHPNLTIGDLGKFSTLLKLGLMFRLSR